MKTILVCINCPKGCGITVSREVGKEPVITGWGCKKGFGYALNEITHPLRILTTTMLKEDGTLAAVRTDQAIPKELLLPAMEILRQIPLRGDVSYGDVVLKNLLDTGKNVIVTRA